jgi:3-oxoadipate enol-lactonase
MFAESNGQRIWFDVHGEQGPPVLLIMGFGMPGIAWVAQVRGLRNQHRVAIFDHRGVGRSATPRLDRFSMQDMAQDAAAVMDAAGMETAHVVGVSMGGMVAQELALSLRQRCRSLTLIATHAGGTGPHTLPTAHGIHMLFRANTSKGIRRLQALRSMLFPKHIQPSIESNADLVRESAETLGHPAEPQVMLRQLYAIARHSTARRLRHLEGLPTLVVKPAMDVVVQPHNSDRLHRLIPGSVLLSFQDAGHGVTTQYADKLNAHLITHFEHADAAQAASSRA